jgi:small subunit ribosomal protein S16
MATRIRLRRLGATKRPFFRVVVTDQRNARDGRFIENIGKYHPLDDPSLIEIDEERALHWLRTGAQPSGSVRNLLEVAGIWAKFAAERPSVRRRADIEARNAARKQARSARSPRDAAPAEETASG